MPDNKNGRCPSIERAYRCNYSWNYVAAARDFYDVHFPADENDRVEVDAMERFVTRGRMDRAVRTAICILEPMVSVGLLKPKELTRYLTQERRT